MGTSVLHIKTEIECKVFLYGEEKGIATPDTYFNIEVRRGEQDLLFVSTEYYIIQCNLLFFVEENDHDYRIVLGKSSFRSLTQSSIEDCIDDKEFVAYSTDGKHLARRRVYDYLNDYDELSIVQDEDKIIVTNLKGETININDVKSVSSKKNYHVKDGCEIIDDWAFCDHDGFSCDVDYHSYYRFCNEYAYGNIEQLTFPNCLKYIGDGAFSHTPLDSIELPQDLKHIGRHAFNESKVRIVGDKIKQLRYIGDGAFKNSRLQHLKIPPSIEYIGNEAFYGCKRLEWLSFDSKNSYNNTHIGDFAFYGCDRLLNVSIPYGTTYIGSCAFFKCSNLKYIYLPSSVRTIGYEAFDSNTLSHICVLEGTRKYFEDILSEELHSKLMEINRGQAIPYGIEIPSTEINILTSKEKSTTSEKLIKKIDICNHSAPYYLFFDTETTGVPKDDNAPASDIRNWPRLVQLAWILTDKEGNTLSSSCSIIKPEGFTIPDDAAKVHGIHTYTAMREGKPLKNVIDDFLKAAAEARCLVGHNVSFDQKIVGAELCRLGIKDTISTVKAICTMEASKEYCEIPGGYYGYKPPKLQELYQKLFGTTFDNAHDAMADVKATKKCFFELKRLEILELLLQEAYALLN